MGKSSKHRRDQGSGSVYQRKSDGYWVAQVLTGYRPDGRPQYKCRYRKSNAEAVAALRQMTADQVAGRPLSTTKTKVGDFLDEWLKTMVKGQREPKTVDYYSGMIELHIKPALGRVELGALSPALVQRLLADCSRKQYRGRDLSASTVRGIRATLRAAMGHAWRLALIPENPVLKTQGPRMTKKPPRYMTVEEAQRLVSAAKGDPIENVLKFMLATGVRLGEAAGLRWEDVDTERGVVKIRVQLQRIEGKLQHKPLKSESSRRNLGLLGMGLTAVQAENGRQLMARSELGAAWANPLDLVFLNSEYRPFDAKNVHRRLQAACERAEIPPLGVHAMRHTAATLSLGLGTSLANVRDLLGHSQVSLTKDLYGHALPEAQRTAAEALDRALRSDS